MRKSLQDKFYKLPHLIKTTPHSGILLREKIFVNFEVLWLSVKVFSTKLGGKAFLVAPGNKLQKFSRLMKDLFSPIRETFAHESFPLYGTR